MRSLPQATSSSPWSRRHRSATSWSSRRCWSSTCWTFRNACVSGSALLAPEPRWNRRGSHGDGGLALAARPFSADDISSRLTEPSPLLSSLPKTSSACAMLVPPAPSAFSNSDLADLAVAIGVDLREQILAARPTGWSARKMWRRRLALRRQQRAHGGRRYLRTAAGIGGRSRVSRSRGAAGDFERVGRSLAEAGGLRRTTISTRSAL